MEALSLLGAVAAFAVAVFVVWKVREMFVSARRKYLGLDQAPVVGGVEIVPYGELEWKAKGVTFKSRGGFGASGGGSAGRLIFDDKRLLFTNTQGSQAALDVPLSDVTGIHYKQSLSSAWSGGRLTVAYRADGGERSMEFQPAGGNTQYASLKDEYDDVAEWIERLQTQRKSAGLAPVAVQIESAHHSPGQRLDAVKRRSPSPATGRCRRALGRRGGGT